MSMCEQNCGRIAECYAGGPNHNDWAGHYCLECAKALKFNIMERYTTAQIVERLKRAFAKNNIILTETTLDEIGGQP